MSTMYIEHLCNMSIIFISESAESLRDLNIVDSNETVSEEDSNDSEYEEAT
ncbi:8807_t:CDS:2, partial [Entrophospora sp. SA101]